MQPSCNPVRERRGSLPLQECPMRSGDAPKFRCAPVAVCLALLFAFCRLASAQHTTDSPIKVHGGSMTFFSQANWEETATGSNVFCTAIHASDLRQLHLQGFFENKDREFRRQGVLVGGVPLTSPTWRVELRGHAAEEARTGVFTVSQEGIVLQASPKDCHDSPRGGPSIRISPLNGSRFYPDDLLAGGLYRSNKRFFSTCSRELADRCERMAEIQVFDRDPRTPVRTFTCPDGTCAVYVGQIKPGPVPTVLISGGKPTAEATPR